MDTRSRLYAASALVAPQGGVFTLLPTSFVTHLLLFDEYTLRSYRLSEFAQLLSYFSHDSISRLLEHAWFNVDCSLNTLGILGPRSVEHRQNSVVYGPYNVIHVTSDQRLAVHDGMRAVDELLGRGSKKSKQFRRALAGRVLPPDQERLKQALAQAKSDIDSRPALVNEAVAVAASRFLGRDIAPADFSLDVRVVPERGTEVHGDVAIRLSVSPETALQIVDNGILGILGLSERLELMKVHNATVALRQNEHPFVERRIEHLVKQLNPDAPLEKFHRVVGAAGLPELTQHRGLG